MKYLAALFLIAAVCAAIPAPTNAQTKRVATETKSRAQIESEIFEMRDRTAVLKKELIKPAADDVARYAKFLEGGDTGLIRLLPREKYDGVLTIRGGGAYYSFVRRTHEYGYGSDISLEQNNFGIASAGAGFGFITMLGDVPLDAVTAEMPGVRYLTTFEPPRPEAEAREQYKRGWRSGFEVDGFTYLNRAPVRLNRTYALRSIDYDNSDVLVAFRVVREDADSSRVLLWRLLKEYPKPELERASN